MSPQARVAHLVALILAVAAAAMTPAAHAAFGVTEGNFEAGTCSTVLPNCTYASVEKDHSEAFTQAAGHPHWGITTFEVNHKKELLNEEPEGSLKRLRVDVPPGLAADPEALPKCAEADFNTDKCPLASQVGTTELTVWLAAIRQTLTGNVYNLQQPAGLPLEFGIHVEVPLVANEHIFLKGHVAWSSDYHEYFEIDNISKAVPVLKSKLNFDGNAGQGNFLTLPSVCSSTTTSFLEVESWAGEISRTPTHTPVGVEGCDKVPFKPTAQVKPETAQWDLPDGATTEVLVAQNVGPTEINTADIKDAHVTLPEGMTLNPAAARGLATCSPAQIGIGTENAVSCPGASEIGTVTIETDLPPGVLAGKVFLGNPAGGAITGPPYTIYVDAEAPAYGVSVRLKGLVNTNPNTGRLEASFTENPQLPFSDFIMKLKGGAQAPVANPLACGTGQVESLFTPYTGGAAALSSSPFVTSGCPSPLPFSLAQSTQSSSPAAGAYTAYTFNLARPDGQQYLSKVTTVLPPGLVGAIPSVTLCGEPQAQTGACPASSQIGTATVAAGAGPEPMGFSGPVFLTGSYNGAPYGLSIPVAAVAGPFDFGTVVTRVAIGVDQYTGRVIATSALPTIVRGVPLRLKNVSVLVNRPSFLFNPTNCGALATNSTLTSTFGATANVSSPFQVANCNALAFKPSFKVSSSAKTSKANGAGLQVNVTQGAHQANIRSVFTQLPLQLPSRLTTLQKACPEATFAANPLSCPAGSNVGTASASTPVLPGQLTGPAYLVSHGGAAFPDLDLVLQYGLVRVILVGNTNIKKGITTSTFASIPDVPVSSFTLSLPSGPHSALAANGNLCAHSLIMPTVITAQSGAQIKQNTRIAVAGCGVRIVRRKIKGHTLILTVQTFAAGRLTATGKNLKTASRRVRKASTTTLKLKLSRAGLSAVGRHHPLKLRVRVRFVPSHKGEARSSASTTVKLRH
ncbi:MAG: hypothetical protein JWO21_1655 [Solirubrobacterales bacterium]|nr:hypothetical protein [Solirubrobacterales bacterium]